jgi:hypothetical protein
MKKLTVKILLLLLFSNSTFAQVAINNDGSQPDSSAMLDIKSDNLGLLPPRMIRAQMNQIHNPAPGLIVFCTDCKGLNIYSSLALWGCFRTSNRIYNEYNLNYSGLQAGGRTKAE